MWPKPIGAQNDVTTRWELQIVTCRRSALSPIDQVRNAATALDEGMAEIQTLSLRDDNWFCGRRVQDSSWQVGAHRYRASRQPTDGRSAPYQQRITAPFTQASPSARLLPHPQRWMQRRRTTSDRRSACSSGCGRGQLLSATLGAPRKRFFGKCTRVLEIWIFSSTLHMSRYASSPTQYICHLLLRPPYSSPSAIAPRSPPGRNAGLALSIRLRDLREFFALVLVSSQPQPISSGKLSRERHPRLHSAYLHSITPRSDTGISQNHPLQQSLRWNGDLRQHCMNR